MSSRWDNKVVDAPCSWRSHSGGRRSVDATNLRSSIEFGSIPTSSPAVVAATPVRRPSAASAGRGTSPRADGMSLPLGGTEQQERNSRRMVASPARPRSQSPFAAGSPQQSPVTAGRNFPTMTAGGPLFETSRNEQYMYSKRMSPARAAETSSERQLSTAVGDISIGRGRCHSPSHRNYTDVVKVSLQAGQPQGTAPAAATEGPPSRPALRPFLQKYADSSKCDAAHWKPMIHKRCTSPRPSLVGVMKPVTPLKASPFKLVPPFGVTF